MSESEKLIEQLVADIIATAGPDADENVLRITATWFFVEVPQNRFVTRRVLTELGV